MITYLKRNMVFKTKNNTSYLLSILLGVFSILNMPLHSQIKKLEKITKIKRDTHNFLDTVEFKKRQKKDKSLYIVYSDRAENNVYLDVYAHKRGKKQGFLDSYYVIDQQNDFLKIVAVDPEMIGKPKGILSVLHSGKFTFKDSKKINYIGWIHKNNILDYPHSKLSEYNYKPIRYIVGVHNVKTLYTIKNHVKKDTVYLFNDPKFKDKSDKKVLLDQLVYVYKYNVKQTAALISNQPYIKAEDTVARTMGWVPKSLIKQVGQQQVITIDKAKELAFFKKNEKPELVTKKEIGSSIIYNLSKNQKRPIKYNDSIEVVVPFAVWDHYDNKLINVDGGDVLIRNFEAIKEENKIININYIFDCNDDLKKKQLQLMSSLQRIWLLALDEKYSDYEFSFSASSYGCDKFYAFPKSKSFSAWVDYLQNIFSDTGLVTTDQPNINGIQQCFEYATQGIPAESFTNNIILISGEKRFFSVPNMEYITTKLGRTSSRLIFYQLENNSSSQNQDYLLQAKDILNRVSKYHSDFIRAYIVDNDLIKNENTYVNMPSTDNVYIYDSPKNSTYQGGLAFPKINKKLSPVSFDKTLDSVLTKTIKFNEEFANSLQYHADNLGFLRSKSGKKVKELILKDDTYSNSLLVMPKNYMYEKFYKNQNYTSQDNKRTELGCLLNRDELEILVDSYKSLVPLFSHEVKRKQRRLLKRMYRKNRKNINKKIFRKTIRRRDYMADLVFIKTGLPVQSDFLQNMKMKHIVRKRKISHAGFTEVIVKLRSKIDVLEKMLLNKNARIYEDGSNKQFYFIPDNYIL